MDIRPGEILYETRRYDDHCLVVALVDQEGRFPLDPPLDLAAADWTIEVAEDQVVIRDGQGIETDRRTWPTGPLVRNPTNESGPNQ